MNRKVGGVMYDDETGKAFIMIQRSFMTACKRDEIRYFYFCDLHHTFANQLVINGIELRTVKVLLSRKTLTATNPTENMFSAVRDCKTNIKRYGGNAMSQRWLAAVLLHCGKGFRCIKGYADIPGVIESIERHYGNCVLIAA